MKLAILFSGGKDSNFALNFAYEKGHEISCLISMISKNSESYMFQSNGLNFTKIQAECLEIPIILKETSGEKEKELLDLKEAIYVAIKKHHIGGVVTGAIRSVYQASRVQKICNELGIWCYNPLWQIEEDYYLSRLLKLEFGVRIISIAAYPLDKNFLGKKIDLEMSRKLSNLAFRYKISAVGEGGEIETFVCDGPLYKKRINVVESEIIMDGENCGHEKIIRVELESK